MEIIIKKIKQRFDFDEKWLEILLTKNILNKKDISDIVHKFNINFTNNKQKGRLQTRDMGIVLMFDIKKNKLLPIIKKIVLNKYPHLISYKEAKKLFTFFETLNDNLLNKLCINIYPNEKIRNFVTNKENKQKFDKEDLLFYLIEGIYKIKNKD